MIPATVIKNAKLANNWKTKSAQELTDLVVAEYRKALEERHRAAAS